MEKPASSLVMGHTDLRPSRDGSHPLSCGRCYKAVHNLCFFPSFECQGTERPCRTR